MSDTSPTPEEFLKKAENLLGMPISFADDPTANWTDEQTRSAQQEAKLESLARERERRLKGPELYTGHVQAGHGCAVCGGIIHLGEPREEVLLPSGRRRARHTSASWTECKPPHATPRPLYQR